MNAVHGVFVVLLSVLLLACAGEPFSVADATGGNAGMAGTSTAGQAGDPAGQGGSLGGQGGMNAGAAGAEGGQGGTEAGQAGANPGGAGQAGAGEGGQAGSGAGGVLPGGSGGAGAGTDGGQGGETGGAGEAGQGGSPAGAGGEDPVGGAGTNEAGAPGAPLYSSCSADADCDAGLTCDPLAKTCTQPCDGGNACPGSGVCAADPSRNGQPALGHRCLVPCSRDADCAAGAQGIPACRVYRQDVTIPSALVGACAGVPVAAGQKVFQNGELLPCDLASPSKDVCLAQNLCRDDVLTTFKTGGTKVRCSATCASDADCPAEMPTCHASWVGIGTEDKLPVCRSL